MDAKFMDMAINLAKEAGKNGDIPVGAVVVKDGKVIATGFNNTLSSHTVLSHAECIAIDNACKVLDDWRLDGCSLYVTLEPCLMCMGAILNSRISEVVFGAFDNERGAAEGKMRPESFGKLKIYAGVRESECTEILNSFFKEMREQ